MYRQELAPTQENIINTFLADPAGRSSFAVDLFQILQRFDTGISIAIDVEYSNQDIQPKQ